MCAAESHCGASHFPCAFLFTTQKGTKARPRQNMKTPMIIAMIIRMMNAMKESARNIVQIDGVFEMEGGRREV